MAELLLSMAVNKNFHQSEKALEKGAENLVKSELPVLEKLIHTNKNIIPKHISPNAHLEQKAKIPVKLSTVEELAAKSTVEELAAKPKQGLQGWMEESGSKFKNDFLEKDTIDQVQMLGNTVGPTVNMLPRESGFRNKSKEAISAMNAAALVKDLIVDEKSRTDPVHLLKRITWIIGPSFDILPNGPEKVAITSFILGTNALHIMSTEKESFAKKSLINKLRKVVDDFIYNIAELLAPGPLKDAHYMLHRGIHGAALVQNYKKIYALGPGSEDALRSLGTSLKTLPDGPFKQILRQIIGGLRSLSMVRNPW